MKQTIETAYSSETLRRLQQCELEILKLFDKICEENCLQYFALYGTLLGAVRHKGIIPWDDDIDVGIPREDYDKFCEIMKDHCPEGYEFLNGQINPNYPFMTARLMKKGTEFRMLSMKDCKCNLGIFLDIFPIDAIPDDPAERSKMLRKCWFWEKLTILRNTPFPNLPYHGVKRALAYTACAIGALCVKIFPKSYLHMKTLETRTMCKGQKTQDIAYPFGLNIDVSIWPVEKIYPLKRIPFEDFEIPVPADTDYVLTLDFGKDYMTPLPEGKRSFIVPYKLSLGDTNKNED